MMEALLFSMSGLPRGQGRPRATVRKAGKRAFATVYKAKEDRQYETSIAAVARGVMGDRPPLTGALSVSMRFRMPIPASATKARRAAMAAGEVPHTSKPDGSNMQKAVEDAMSGVVFTDDSQIVRGFWSKIYSDNPGVDVRIAPLEPQESGE